MRTRGVLERMPDEIVQAVGSGLANKIGESRASSNDKSIFMIGTSNKPWDFKSEQSIFLTLVDKAQATAQFFRKCSIRGPSSDRVGYFFMLPVMRCISGLIAVYKNRLWGDSCLQQAPITNKE